MSRKAQCLVDALLLEIGGAVNWWVDPAGKVHNAGPSHVDWAARFLNIKLASHSAGSGYWEAQGRVYTEMFKRNWVRVSIVQMARELMVDSGPNVIKQRQMDTIYDKAAEDGLRVVDDHGHELADFRQGMGESVQQLVHRLLEADPTVDAKARLAQLEPKYWLVSAENPNGEITDWWTIGFSAENAEERLRQAGTLKPEPEHYLAGVIEVPKSEYDEMRALHDEHGVYENGPRMDTLKSSQKPLDDDERAQVMQAKAVWHHGAGGAETPAVKKSVVDGKTWYWSATHRTYQAHTTLKAAIRAFHEVVEPSA